MKMRLLGLLAVLGVCFGSAQAQRLEIFPQLGHAGAVNSIAFSPDGHILASGSQDNTIKLWDVASGRELRTLSGHTNWVRSVAFSPDGRILASASKDTTIKLWDVASGRELRTLTGHAAEVSSIAFSPDGRALASGSWDQTVKLWDVASGQLMRSLSGHSTWILSIAFSPDGHILASRDAGETARLWDVTTGRALRSFNGRFKTGFFASIAFSPDGRILALGSQDKMVRLVDSTTGRELRTLSGHSNWISSVTFSPNGQFLASGSADGTAKLWDVASGRELHSVSGSSFFVSSVAFSPDGRVLASGSWDGSIKLWDATSGQELRTLSGHSALGTPVAFAPDGHSLLSSGALAIVWDTASGRELRLLSAHSGWVNSVAFAPDGRVLATGGADHTIKLWDAASGRELQTLSGHSGGVTSLAFSPDGRVLASGSADQTVKLWDLASGRELHTLTDHYGMISSVAFSPDGRILASDSGDDTIRLWDVQSGRELRTLHLGPPSLVAGVIYFRSVAFSPDGRTLASGGGNNSVQLWEVASGRALRTLTGHTGRIYSVAFSPDGRMLASGSEDKTVKLWDVTSGLELRALRGHSGWISSVSFSADSERLASSSSDGTIRLWEVSSGTEEALLIASSDDSSLAITPEGFFAASERGADLLNVVRGLDVWSIGQFYQALYRPDLVREKLAGDPRGLVRDAAARLDLDKVLASGNAPDVEIVSPAAATNTTSTQIAVDVELTGRGGGVGRVEWRVNGLTVGVDNPTAPPAGQPLRLTRTLALDAGINTIDVVAYNGANLIASEPTRITVALQPPAPPPVPAPTITPAPNAPAPPPVATAPPATPTVTAAPRLFVLAAGANNYADPRFRLSYSVPDAQSIADAFTQTGNGLYRSVEVTLLKDSNVTREKLDAAFADLAQKVKPTDVFVLYLAGHGKTLEGRYYFAPQPFRVDGELSNANVDAAVLEDGIAQEQWQRWFAEVPARKSLILFDTCESGTLTASENAETKELERGAASDRLAQATGRSIMTASTGSAEALEGYHRHGLFTYNILDALDRADGDGNGTIEITELAAYVYAEVTAISEQVFKLRQEPQMRITLNFPLTRQGDVLKEDVAPVAINTKPAVQLTHTAELQIKPGAGATVVRSLSAQTRVTVVESKDGWALIASGGKPLGYVATRDLAPAQ
jgi:WD40 repeat protein/uncharacterized caspase-like protein